MHPMACYHVATSLPVCVCCRRLIFEVSGQGLHGCEISLWITATLGARTAEVFPGTYLNIKTIRNRERVNISIMYRNGSPSATTAGNHFIELNY